MSYMRGEYYVYKDVGGYFVLPNNMPVEIFDELVVMRYAQLKTQRKAKKAEERAMKNWDGNFGCWELLKKNNRDPEKGLNDLLKKIG